MPASAAPVIPCPRPGCEVPSLRNEYHLVAHLAFCHGVFRGDDHRPESRDRVWLGGKDRDWLILAIIRDTQRVNALNYELDRVEQYLTTKQGGHTVASLCARHRGSGEFVHRETDISNIAATCWHWTKGELIAELRKLRTELYDTAGPSLRADVNLLWELVDHPDRVPRYQYD